MRPIDTAERRRRLGVRHRLAPGHRAVGALQAARGVVALHATDPATVFLSVQARTADAGPEPTQAAIYDERALVRMLGMRRTMYVVPADLASVVQASTMGRVATAHRRLLVKQLREAGVADDADAWLSTVEAATLTALRARGGVAAAAELSADEPLLRTSLLMAAGKAYEARGPITNRVLTQLGAQGLLIRGRPTGSWLSQRYAWALAESWLPREGRRWSEPQAAAELARRWLRACGPGTQRDLQWWTGWTVSQTKTALADVQAVPVEVEGAGMYVLPDDLDPTPEQPPWAALLPALDPTVMGWADREWYLGEHVPALFDATGNAGPTIWLDGRVVGGWAQRPDGEVVVELLEDVGSSARELVADRCEALQRWLGPNRVVPKFRTPLERRLSS